MSSIDLAAPFVTIHCAEHVSLHSGTEIIQTEQRVPRLTAYCLGSNSGWAECLIPWVSRKSELVGQGWAVSSSQIIVVEFQFQRRAKVINELSTGPTSVSSG